MCKKLLTVLLVLALSSMASATDWQFVGGNGTAWNDSLNWNTNTDESGSFGIPAAGDRPRDYLALPIDLSTTTPDVSKFQQIGGTVTVKSGGVLNTDGSVEHNAGGTITIDSGGTINACKKLVGTIGTFKIGRGTSATTNTVNVDGTLNVLGSLATSDIGLGTWSGAGTAGGSWILNINDGGVANANYLTVNTNPASGTAKITISGSGELVLDGDVTAFIHVLRSGSAAGYIVFYGGATPGGVTYDYNVTHAGKTTVHVPEPATIALLGLGGLLLRKRR